MVRIPSSIPTRIAEFFTYDARTDPAIIPAKLDLGTMGTIPYQVKEAQADGTYKVVTPSDPNRTFRFVRADNSTQASKWFDSVLPRRVVATLGALYAILGATTGACLALGLYPAAIVTAAILATALFTVGTQPSEGDNTPVHPRTRYAF